MHWARLDARGRIAIDLECIGCRYNLRMSDAEGRCPECGLAVGRSSVGRYLCYHEPKWVRCLAWGMNRFAVALVALFVSVLIFAVLGVMGLDEFHQSFAVQLSVLVGASLPCVAIGFAVLGLARATWPDPAPVRPETWASPRRLTRIACLLGVLMIGMNVAYEVVAAPAYSSDNWIKMGLVLVTMSAWLAVPVCLLLHARNLAVMIPRPWLGRWTLAVMLAIGLSGLVFVGLSDNWFGWYDAVVPAFNAATAVATGPGGFSGYYYWSPGDPWHYHEGFVWVLEWVQAAAAVAWGLSVLGIVPLFFVYWSALHKEAGKAKATWAASPWVGRGESGELNGQGRTD